MTTSPSPSRPVSEDSAKAVGFELVKHYYTNLMSNPSTIYGMYGKTASLQHHNPFKGDFTRIDVSYSRDDIRDHYKNNSVFQDCKIAVHNLDAQPSNDGSVMILCNGEIAFTKTDKIGPSFRFVQSFYITPKKSENVTYYDIINDILRFLPDVDNEFMQEDKGEKEEIKDDAKDDKELTSEQKKEEVKEEVKEEEVKEEEVKGEEELKKEISNEVEKEVEQQPVNEEEQVDSDSKSKTEENPKEEDTAATTTTGSNNTNSSKPISWAARVATSSTTPIAKNAKIVSPQVTPVVSVNPSKENIPIVKDHGSKSHNNNNNGNNKRRSSNGKKFAKKEESTSPVGGGSGSNTITKNLKKKFTNKRNEEVYPIYIKGLNSEIDSEDQLVLLLEREFGKIDSCKLNNYVALVDFTKQSAQDKAIQMGTIKLNDHDLRLEPRIEKRKERK